MSEDKYKKSLEAMDEYLSILSEEEFLEAFNQCEKGRGMLAADFIENNFVYDENFKSKKTLNDPQL